MNPDNSINPTDSMDTSNKILHLILFVIAIITGGVLYHTSLFNLVSAVIHRDGSSHGVFIPFISAWFIWQKWDLLKKIDLRVDLLGIPLLLIGFIFPFLHFGSWHLECICFLVLSTGAVILFLGTPFFREISFPMLFLIVMIPIPDGTYRHMADITRDITFGGSEWVISVLGLTYFRDGYILHLPNAVLHVAESCSGIRYLISYFVFGIAYAYLTREKNWKRLAVVISTIPISLLASIGRLTVIFLATYYISPKMAAHWPHIFLSWTVFFVVLIIAIGTDQHFQKRFEKKEIQKA